MKIGFRQVLALAVSALLLFSSAGVWAYCEKEIEHAIKVRTEYYTQKSTHPNERKEDQERARNEMPRIRAFLEKIGKDINDFAPKIKNDSRFKLADEQRYLATDESDIQKYNEQINRLKARGDAYGALEWLSTRTNSVIAHCKHRVGVAMLSGQSFSQLPAPDLDSNLPPSSGVPTQTNQANQDAQQRQQAQAAVELAQDNARIGQARADASAQRAGRRTHDPAAEAHECVQLDNPASAYPVNNCAFKINVAMCVTDPRSTNNFFNANDSFQCQNLKTGGGLWSPEAGRPIQGIVPKSAGMIYWFACKAPSNPSDTEFTGSAISARCN